MIVDNRCPRCCTRAFLRLSGYMKCLACGFEPKPFYYPLYVDPGAVMSTRRLNNLIDIWEREERCHLERERRKAAAHYERSQRVAEKARRLVVKARSDEVEFLRQCDRLAWHRQKLADHFGVTRDGISKRMVRYRIHNAAARAVTLGKAVPA